MNETESLLPCPFCGGSADFARVTRGFGVIAGCNLCQASVFAIDENNPSNIASHRKLAADAWNRRTDTIPRATVAAALAELREDIWETGKDGSFAIGSTFRLIDATVAKLGLEEKK